MSAGSPTDVAVAKALATLPIFEVWHNAPLDADTRRTLATADQQTLMSIAAHALRLAMREADEPASG